MRLGCRFGEKFFWISERSGDEVGGGDGVEPVGNGGLVPLNLDQQAVVEVEVEECARKSKLTKSRLSVTPHSIGLVIRPVDGNHWYGKEKPQWTGSWLLWVSIRSLTRRGRHQNDLQTRRWDRLARLHGGTVPYPALASPHFGTGMGARSGSWFARASRRR